VLWFGGFRRAATSIVAGGLVAGLALTGCGGSSSSSTSSSTASSAPAAAASISGKDVFVTAAETICHQTENQVPQPPGDPSHARPDQLPTWMAYLQTVVSLEQKELSDLRALAQPPGEEAAINDIFAKQQEAIADSQAALQAATQSDFGGFQAAVAKFNTDNAAAKAAASAYGLDTCAE
jgi:hypothetical protein